jgi:UDP-N-acetylglucosamine--N-acetylmuramyl-(pentapeptide) pyrophosphoryl-undecaprenol N-acetylglucosamine transferase
MARILIAGGGTGGHLFPGLAVAQALQKRGAEILFVGTRAGVEAKIIPKYNFPLDFINVAGFKRGRLFSNLGFPVKVIQAAGRAGDRRLRQRPDPFHRGALRRAHHPAGAKQLSRRDHTPAVAFCSQGLS